MNWSLLGLKRLTPTIMHKCLETLLHFWGVFLSTQAHPSSVPHNHCWTRVSRILHKVRGGGGVGGRGDCKKISKRMHCFMREPRMTEKSEYCITVLGTFIHNYTCFRRPITSLSSLVLISSYEVNGF